MRVQYLNSCVYSLIINDKKESVPVIRQPNNPLMVIGVEVCRTADITYNKIVEYYTERYKDAKEPLKVMACYPYTKDLADTVMDYTYAHGYMVEWIKPDPNETFITMGELSVDEQTEALKEHLLPKPIVKPFVLMFPETGFFMFNVSLDYAPETAVQYLDAEHDHNVEAGMEAVEEDMAKPVTPNILFDPGVHITPEDREALIQKILDMEAAKQAEEAKTATTDNISQEENQ